MKLNLVMIFSAELALKKRNFLKRGDRDRTLRRRHRFSGDDSANLPSLQSHSVFSGAEIPLLRFRATRPTFFSRLLLPSRRRRFTARKPKDRVLIVIP